MEVEVKARVADRAALAAALARRGARFERVVQRDAYYIAEPERRQRRPGDWIVRTRRASNGSWLTYKQLTGMAGVWREYESRVADVEAVERILEAIGLVKLFEVVKTRLRCSVDGFEVSLDHVEGLGDFVEVALEVGDDADYQAARAKVMSFLSALIGQVALEPRGYGELIAERLGYSFEGMQ